MKKFLQVSLLCVLLCSLGGCAEDVSVRSIKGAYRYKMSGSITVTPPDEGSSRLHTLTETGVMEVVSLHDGSDLLLTFNQSGGGVYHTRGSASEETLHFDPFKRTVTTELETYEVEVSGRGEVYENTLILYLTFNGKSLSSDKTLQGTDIQLLAQKN